MSEAPTSDPVACHNCRAELHGPFCAQCGQEALPHDRAGYFDVTSDEAADVRKEMVNALESLGIVVEASHHEVATGQHEIDFRYAEALSTADNTVAFKIT